MRRLISGMVIFALILTSTRMVYAEDKAEIPVIVRIPQMIAMSLDTSELVFDEVDFDYVLGTAQFTRVGVIATKKQAVTATIWGNVHYTLSISAPDEYLTGANGGLLHISQLRWRLPDPDNANGWEPISLERVPVQNGPPGTQEVKFDFQLMAYWENPAQTYTGEILLTVVPDAL